MKAHTLSLSTYWGVFVVLIGLTLLTIGISLLELGEWHAVVGLIIATAKVALVALFFMHLLHSSRLTWVVAAAGLLWLGILLGLTLSDYLTRHWLAY